MQICLVLALCFALETAKSFLLRPIINHGLHRSTSLRSSTKFTERVEYGLDVLFEPGEVERVRDAWRRMNSGLEFSEPIGDGEHPLMVQKCTSYVPGLEPVLPFHDTAGLAWVESLEGSWEEIAAELKSVLADENKLSRGSNVWVGPLGGDDVAKAYGNDWKTLGLCDRAEWDEDNVALFPRTSRALHRSGVAVLEALFAKMPAGSTIQPHSDMTNFVLTAHLGVDVPDGKCWLQVGSERREWKNGKVMLFDTSLLHEAANTSPTDDRYVLMLRVWHPDLTPPEREALQFLFDASGDASLVMTDEGLFRYDTLASNRENYFKGLLESLDALIDMDMAAAKAETEAAAVKTSEAKSK